jgi:rhodanese-related sulfurtransferase
MGRSSIRVAVVSDEQVPTTQAWLAGGDMRPDVVIQVQSPLSFGVFATPTLVIVDQNGRVRDIFIGKVPAKTQGLLWARVHGSEEVAPIDNAFASHEIEDRELELMNRRTAVQVLDVRPRAAYSTEHRSGAYNIPRDELPARAPVELGTERPIVLDGRTQQPSICRSTAHQLRELLGFDDVYVLANSR